ncbi:MAG: hypothetical protein BWY99_02704 [Synergistetes bacterium ADurb.BinA166]|nr:MAG: hypothetical protein BWY99_02704 [Synergistetes bacterium ADurb.BinA166]
MQPGWSHARGLGSSSGSSQGGSENPPDSLSRKRAKTTAARMANVKPKLTIHQLKPLMGETTVTIP